MSKRPVRLTLLLVFLAAMGVTAYLFRANDRQAASITEASRTFDASARDAESRVGDLRNAQQAYVAQGQGPDFWFARTTAILADLKTRVATLKAQASASNAPAFDEVTGAMQDFDQMDGRAREYVSSHQMVLASDLLFADGVDVTRRMTEAIDRARTAQMAVFDAARDAVARRQMFSAGAAAAAATLIVLLLIPAGRREDQASAEASAPQAVLSVASSPADETWTRARPAGEAETSPVVDTPAAAPVASAPTVDLSAVASVCSSLAKLNDTQALPAALEQAAAALDASGIILWIADPDCRELAPIVTHGYAPNLVTRLGTIQRDAENATAAALRTGLVQTVKNTAISDGAIAAPLVTPTGVVGVMAAEVRRGGEAQPNVLAAATIVAAQLATLVGPPSARAKAEAAG